MGDGLVVDVLETSSSEVRKIIESKDKKSGAVSRVLALLTSGPTLISGTPQIVSKITPEIILEYRDRSNACAQLGMDPKQNKQTNKD